MGAFEFAVFYAQAAAAVLRGLAESVPHCAAGEFAAHWILHAADYIGQTARAHAGLAGILLGLALFAMLKTRARRAKRPACAASARPASFVSTEGIAISQRAFTHGKRAFGIECGDATGVYIDQWVVLVSAADPGALADLCRRAWGVQWIILSDGTHLALPTLGAVSVVVATNGPFRAVQNVLNVPEPRDVDAVTRALLEYRK